MPSQYIQFLDMNRHLGISIDSVRGYDIPPTDYKCLHLLSKDFYSFPRQTRLSVRRKKSFKLLSAHLALQLAVFTSFI